MKRISTLLCASALLAGAALDTSAQTGASNPGYATDTRGAVVKTPFGLCVRTGSWTPAMATEECDADLLPKKPVPVVAPRAAPPATPPAAAPAPSAAPPAPATRATPVTEKVSLAADTLFDFNKSAMRPDGRAKLDDLVTRVKGVSLETIIAIGHTDRIGSTAYNQKLSQRRAEAVKGYLVSKGIPANRIYTEGKGEKQPVTKSNQCPGAKSAKVIACLQPDRRVDVEVVGTRTK